MAGNIKGITISFSGDTTKLDSALRNIDKSTKSLDKELKQVNNALKFNPTSVELWRQKQDLLTKKVAETKTKLDVLKQAQAKMDAEGVDKNSEEYRKLQRQIIVTKNQVKNFEGQLRKVGNAKLTALSEQFKSIGGKIEETGQKLMPLSKAAAGVTAGIGAMAYKAGTAADNINTLSKITGIGTGELQKYQAAADLVDVPVEAIAKATKKLSKNAYSAANGSKSQAKAFKQLGVDVKDANGNLKSSDQIFQETIAKLGEMENETERDALAMKLMGGTATELNPLIEDGGKTYKQVAETMKQYDLEFVDQDTLNRANEFNDQLDTIKLIGLTAFQQIGSQLAANLAPALEKVVKWVGKFASWLSKLDPKILTVIAGVSGFLAVLAPLIITIGKLATGIGAIISLVGKMGPMIKGLKAGIGLLSSGSLLPIIAVIAAVVAAGVLLYKNWDKIKATATKIATAIKTAWTNMKTAVVDKVKTMVETVKLKIVALRDWLKDRWEAMKTRTSNAWEAIKNYPIDKIKAMIENVKEKVKAFRDWIGDRWDAIKTRTSNAWEKVKSYPIDKIKEMISEVKEKILDIRDWIDERWEYIKYITEYYWDKIKEKILSPFETVKEKVEGIVDKIKGLFPIDIGALFDKIKLPHFSWEWEDVGDVISLPKISVDWYDKGGIFDHPSVIGVGEKRPEFVGALDDLREIVREESGTGEITINVYGTPGMDVNQLAQAVEQKLVQAMKQRKKAYGSI